MKRKGLIFLAVLVFLAAGGLLGEYLLTREAEAQLASVIQERLNLTSAPRVSIVAHPLLYKLYVGRIDLVEIEASEVPYREARIDQVAVTIRNLSFNSNLLLKDRQLLVEKVDLAMIKVLVSEEQVNEYVQEMLPGSIIKLEKDRLRYLGKVSYFGQELDLNVVGTISVDPTQNTVSFFPDKKSLESLPVPAAAKEYLAASLATQIPLTDLPVETRLLRVTSEPGRLVIEGQLTDFTFFQGR